MLILIFRESSPTWHPIVLRLSIAFNFLASSSFFLASFPLSISHWFASLASWISANRHLKERENPSGVANQNTSLHNFRIPFLKSSEEQSYEYCGDKVSGNQANCLQIGLINSNGLPDSNNKWKESLILWSHVENGSRHNMLPHDWTWSHVVYFTLH